MEVSSEPRDVAGVSHLSLEVIRQYAGDYLSFDQLLDAVRSVDMRHVADVLTGFDRLASAAEEHDLLKAFFGDRQVMRVGPNPCFDEAFYQTEYADVRLSVVAGHLHCGFFHYIKYGLREGRWPHRLVKHLASAHNESLQPIEALSERIYLEANPNAIAFLRSFPFISVLTYHNALGRKLHACVPVTPVSRLGVDQLDMIFATISTHFDPAFYRQRYFPETERSNDELFSHYILHAGKSGYSPNTSFDEEFYRAFYPEVDDAIRSGRVMSGYYHYLVAGSREGRLARFDLKRVLDVRMPGVTTPTLLHRTEDIRRRGEPLGARARFRDVAWHEDGRFRVWVLLPTFNPDIMFGGYKALIELVVALHSAGFSIAMLVTEDGKANKRYLLHRQTSSRVRDVLAAADVFTKNDLYEQEISRSDLVLAYSAWDLHIAAEMAALTDNALPYLLAQEYEPIFYDNSSVRVMCEERYQVPHHALINSRMLETYFRGRGVGPFAPGARGRHVVFEHKVNRLRPASAGPHRHRSNRLLAVYARPEGHAARNLFEIALLALQAACGSGAFGPEWSFIGLGSLSELPPIPLGGGHELRLEMKVSESDYVARMSELDIGLSLMFAPHPSVVPFEFATTGALVITNTYENRSAEELRAICPNFVPCEPSVQGVQAALSEALRRVGDVEDRWTNAYQPRHDSWTEIFSPSFVATTFGSACKEPFRGGSVRALPGGNRPARLRRALSAVDGGKATS